MTQKRRRHLLFLTLLLFSCITHSQTALTNKEFSNWRQNNIEFILFDTRGDNPVDSIVYPCFYTTEPERWIDSLGCRQRLLIQCHAGISAQQTAQTIIGNGYPADSVYYSGFSILIGSRFPASDTLPLSFLMSRTDLPQDLSALHLKAYMQSENGYKVVDVRTEVEIASGLIPGACNMVWPSPFSESLDLFSVNEMIILNCGSGYRAGLARDLMLQNGFDSAKVINFGGFSKWSTAELTFSNTPSDSCNGSGIINVSEIETYRNNFSRIRYSRFQNQIAFINPSPDKIKHIHIYDISGRPIKKTSVVSHTISLPAEMSEGIYFIKISTVSSTLYSKFIYLQEIARINSRYQYVRFASPAPDYIFI